MVYTVVETVVETVIETVVKTVVENRQEEKEFKIYFSRDCIGHVPRVKKAKDTMRKPMIIALQQNPPGGCQSKQTAPLNVRFSECFEGFVGNKRMPNAIMGRHTQLGPDVKGSGGVTRSTKQVN